MRTDARQLSRSPRPLAARLASAEPPDIVEARRVLDVAFARFLRLDVASRDASLDRVRGYRGKARRLGSPGVPSTLSMPGPPRSTTSSEVECSWTCL
jgi:hypothetical protein